MKIQPVDSTIGTRTRLSRFLAVLAIAALFSLLTMLTLGHGVAHGQAAPSSQALRLTERGAPPAAGNVGDLLTRIQCTEPYTAYIYAQGLAAPHGLALNAADELYVAEESAGQVSKISAAGVSTPVVSGLNSPEGLTFDKLGQMYVVEDEDDGRVVKRNLTGATSTLAGGLDSPEDIIWVDDGSGDGILYVTESNLETAVDNESNNPDDYRTYITAISLTGTKTRVLTTSAEFIVNLFPIPTVDATFWSYTSLAYGPDDLLYIANELSGKQTSGTYSGVSYTAESTDAIFTTDPTAASPTATAFANNSTIAPEGITFSADGNFPLYVAEEDINDSEEGRLSRIDSAGNRTTLCTGFHTVEDVVIDGNGWLYVSEDANGLVIVLKPESEPGSAIEPLTGVAISGPSTGNTGESYTFTASAAPLNATKPVSFTWHATGQTSIVHQSSSLTDPISFSWSTAGEKTITVKADNGGPMVNDSFKVSIAANAAPPDYVYLPLIVK